MKPQIRAQASGNFMIKLVLPAIVLILAGCTPLVHDSKSMPATVTRTNFNATMENIVFIHATPSRSGPHSQLFLNNLDYIKSIHLAVGGNVTWPQTDTLTLILSDGCGNELK